MRRARSTRTSELLTRVYIGAVASGGCALLVVAPVVGPIDSGSRPPAVLAMLAVLAVFAELFPLQVTFRHESKDVTLSTTFVFATMLVAGPVAAIWTQAVACGVSDVIARKAPWKILFNVGQYTIAWFGAGVVLERMGFPIGMPVHADTIGALVVAGLVFFSLNLGLIGIGISRTVGVPLHTYLRGDLGFQLSTAVVLLSLAPVVAVIADVSPILVPILAVPIGAIYRSAQASLEKERQAHHDALTGLPNRVLFHDRIGQKIETDPDSEFAVFIVDLDSFKEVNDTLGHGTGDQLLREVGRRLQRAFPDRDATVARLGGDEFALLVPIDDGTQAAGFAASIHGALAAPMLLDGLSVTVGGSVGASLHPRHGKDVETLLRRADIAMYLAKDASSGFEAYTAERDTHTTRRLGLLGELRDAIELGQLKLEYQPIASLSTGEVVAAEALVRWQHPTHGLVMPDEFIPMAEPTGLITPLTAEVIHQALATCRSWHDSGHRIVVAVNVSVRNLYEASFADQVLAFLEAVDLEPSCLELEITESTLMADPGRARGILHRLHATGVGIALDDFGTGYSSLAYLRRLPVSKLKIDRSFVSNMEHDENDAAIVRSIIDLARNLGLEVVAEGVETAQQWRLLADLGCEFAQGYFLGRPGSPRTVLGTRAVAPMPAT